MNILTRNFASTRPVQIATWTYKRYNLIVIFASTRPVQIATTFNIVRVLNVGAFASTRPVQIATKRSIAFVGFPSLCLHTPRADCNCFVDVVPAPQLRLCLHTPRADCNGRNAQNCNMHFLERVLSW